MNRMGRTHKWTYFMWNCPNLKLTFSRKEFIYSLWKYTRRSICYSIPLHITSYSDVSDVAEDRESLRHSLIIPRAGNCHTPTWRYCSRALTKIPSTCLRLFCQSGEKTSLGLGDSSSTQWAAVRTWSPSIRIPPHTCSRPLPLRLTNDGNRSSGEGIHPYSKRVILYILNKEFSCIRYN